MDDVADDERIDLHDFRHGLKLLTETRETVHYRNENDYDCPACGRPFAAVYGTEKRHNSFDPDSSRPFCIRLEPDRVLLFLH